MEVIQINKNGHIFEVQDSQYDGQSFWSRFAHGMWEPQTFEVMDRFLRPWNTYVDIGAWIGPTALYASRHCKWVYAVEPDSVALELLKFNISNNEILNVSIDERAISTNNDGVKLNSTRDLGHSNTNIIGHGGLKDYVSSVTLQSLFEEYNINDVGLLKMDIEGGEFVVLPSCLDWLSAKNITLHLSLHGAHMPGKFNELAGLLFESYSYIYKAGDLTQPLENLDSLKNHFADIIVTNRSLDATAV